MSRPDRIPPSPWTPHLGRVVTLEVERLESAGAFLGLPATEVATPDAAPVLLPKSEVPDGTQAGDHLTVFVTLDSDDRPLATTRTPKLALGEVAFLRVSAITEIGAFVDWGLPKELLVPYREQTRDLQVGERHPVGLFVDKTGRLAGTMRVSELLRAKPVIAADEWIAGEAWRSDPAVGLFVIIERRFVGVVPASEPHGLERGQTASFRVTRVLPDGKFELSLRGKAHEEIGDDAAHVLAILRRPETPAVGDGSTPDQLRALFGLSKKAFKRAVGRLLKERAVTIDGKGSVRPREPGSGGGIPPRPEGAMPPRPGSTTPPRPEGATLPRVGGVIRRRPGSRTQKSG